MDKTIPHKTFPWPLLWLLLLFGVPLGTATFLYVFQHQIPFKITPHGELLMPPIPVATLDFIPKQAVAKGKWQLIYLCQAHQQKNCEKDQELLKRAHLSLGKDQHRVYLTVSIRTGVIEAGENNQILLIDPRGFFIMRYTFSSVMTQLDAKGMLKDIKRLLRFSHVG